jgi:hypothetical protein
MHSGSIAQSVRDLFTAYTQSEKGHPLDPKAQSRMKRCFRADLSKVRIHTDPFAAAITGVFGARALTYGNHIFFRRGEYRPETPAGLHLLAHELAHAVQQGTAQPSGGPASLGAPDDEFEIEAILAASLALAGRPVPPLRPDHSRTIRRAVTFDPASAKIELYSEGAKPGYALFPAQNGLFAHLTKGYFPSTPADPSPAWTAIGSVKVDIPAGESPAGWKLGFIQFLKPVAEQFRFVDPYPPAGYISMDFGKDPRWSNRWILDTGIESNLPWLWSMHVNYKPPNELSCQAQDGPNAPIWLFRKNKLTGRTNYLYDLRVQLEFVCILMTQDPGGRFSALAHFRWSVNWLASLRWHQPYAVGMAMPTIRSSVGSSFTMAQTSVSLGEPPEPEIKAQLGSPSGPTANAIRGEVKDKAKVDDASLVQHFDTGAFYLDQSFYQLQGVPSL